MSLVPTHESSRAEDKFALLSRIGRVRNLATRGCHPDLSGFVDAAAILASSLSDAESSYRWDILELVTGLVDLIEESVSGGISDLACGEILVQVGMVTQDQVDDALRKQQETGLRIGETLVQMGVVSETQVQEALRVQHQLRQASGVPGDLFGSIVPNHPLWEHSFLRRCRARELSDQDVKILAVQMYKFCTEFSRILAATFVRCPDEYARVVIADNLYDETGQGNNLLTHPELFRRFTRALGFSDQELEDMRVEPETQSLIDTYIALPERYGYLAGLGAICYASENIVSVLYTQLLEGISNGVEVADDALAFFHSHVELDNEHANALINLVNRGVHTRKEARKIVLAIKEALAARMRFFDGIERCSQQMRKGGKRATDANL